MLSEMHQLPGLPFWMCQHKASHENRCAWLLLAPVVGWIGALAEGRKTGGAEVKGEVVSLCSVTAYVLLKGMSKRNHKTNVKNKLLVFWEGYPK